MSRLFHIGDILSVTTGRLLSPRHMDGLYDVLGYMTGDRGVMTHQLPLASDAVRPDIRQQHPWVDEVEPPEEFRDKAHVEAFVAEMSAKYGEQHALTPAPQSWGEHDPIADLAEMVPPEKIIVVGIDSEAGESR
jgi:hypothetical protein